MNPEKHVASLELSQKLKAAGFPQDETLFVWIKKHSHEVWGDGGPWKLLYRQASFYGLSKEYADWFAAPIATEIELFEEGEEGLFVPDDRALEWLAMRTRKLPKTATPNVTQLALYFKR